MDAPDEMHYRDCGSIGGGWPHPASAHALDELVEAVAQVLLPWLLPPTRASIDYPLSAARAVLSVPALAEVIARDAKVQEIAPDVVWLAKLARSGSWPGGMAQAVETAASRVIRMLGTDSDRAAQESVTAALYPEAGK